MPCLVDADTGQVLFQRLILADRFWTRAKGLLGKRELADDQAIWIRPCTSIHTFFMRMRINVAFVDSQGTVLAIHENVKPWRILLGARGSVGVIEFSPIAEVLAVGMRVQLDDR